MIEILVLEDFIIVWLAVGASILEQSVDLNPDCLVLSQNVLNGRILNVCSLEEF